MTTMNITKKDILTEIYRRLLAASNDELESVLEDLLPAYNRYNFHIVKSYSDDGGGCQYSAGILEGDE